MYNMNAIEHTYVSLLADVAQHTGFSELRGSYEGLQWCLYEAPKLEKLILDSIETGRKLNLESFPESLRRIAEGSLVDPLLLRFCRQLLLFCYKAYVTHDEHTTKAAFDSYSQTNHEVGKFGSGFGSQSPSLLDLARRHCQSVTYRFREKEVIPSHGPGAVTTSKERWSTRFSTIESLYPYSDWYSLYYNEDHLAHWESMTCQDQILAKLIAVPKDSRGPRLICVHPAEAVWIQQGVRRELERAITLERFQTGPWPHGRIQFDNQLCNGRIALNSSRNGKYATLDLKEASDRISDQLVQILFGRKYKWFGCSRATEYYVPDNIKCDVKRDKIYSYAPMGNATTFPVQSLVFWSICVASLQRRGFHQPGAVFVFGDDIIVPSKYAEVVINDLESFGLLVNRTKSFWRGEFRESCGIDAFKGVDVTPVRWKTTLDAEHLTGLQSLSDIAMRLRIAGYEGAATTAYGILERKLRLHYDRRLFKTNNPEHGGIAEYTKNEIAVWRDAYWHTDLQWFHSPVYRIESLPHKRKCSDWNHVLESIVALERLGSYRVPVRNVSRRSRLDRGWIRVA